MKEYSNCKICNSSIKIINQTHNLVKCTKCELIFCKTIFTQDDFINVYDNLYNSNNGEYQRHSKIEFERLQNGIFGKIGYNRKNILNKNVFNAKCKSVLEVGSGVGLIGAYILSKNKNILYTGIELDREAFKKSKLLKLNTINGDFTEIKKLEQKFDVIMLWEVIEHLQDLKIFVELAYDALKPGGKIILSAPNYNKIYNYSNRPTDRLYQNDPPIHLNFFTSKSLKTVFEIFGFEKCIVKIKRTPYINFKSRKFYMDMFKVIFKKYNGATIYFEASKK